MKLKLSAFIGIILGLVFLISVSQIILGELFPWLNFTIASGLPLIIFLLSFLVQDKKIITLKVVYSFIILQFLIAIYFLINPVYLKLYWNLLFIPTILFICFLFLEFALRKNKLVFNILKISIAILVISILSNLIFTHYLLDYVIICSIISIFTLIIFSKNKVEKE
ncbi:MAG: hypothetical protein RL528_560 [Bacteroidota bacterium]|jgi:hypothetical protein